MKRTQRVTCSVLLAIIMLMTIASPAYAQITLFASNDFSKATVSLSSSGTVAFSATTTVICKKIKVSSCTLQTQSGADWNDSKTLVAPSVTAENTTRYVTTKDYSSSMVSGNTYRIKATFNADGKTITKYSGSIVY